MSEILFLVEQAPEGGYTAQALGNSFFTKADDITTLHTNMRDAVECHFDDEKLPLKQLESTCKNNLL